MFTSVLYLLYSVMYCTRFLSCVFQESDITNTTYLLLFCSFFPLFSFVQARLYFHVFTFITKVQLLYQVRQQLTVNEFYTLQILWQDQLSTYEARIWSINGCMYYYSAFKDRRLKKRCFSALQWNRTYRVWTFRVSVVNITMPSCSAAVIR